MFRKLALAVLTFAVAASISAPIAMADDSSDISAASSTRAKTIGTSGNATCFADNSTPAFGHTAGVGYFGRASVVCYDNTDPYCQGGYVYADACTHFYIASRQWQIKQNGHAWYSSDVRAGSWLGIISRSATFGKCPTLGQATYQLVFRIWLQGGQYFYFTSNNQKLCA
jgi:hypothetical protein